jgi:hypothetical protein
MSIQVLSGETKKEVAFGLVTLDDVDAVNNDTSSDDIFGGTTKSVSKSTRVAEDQTRDLDIGRAEEAFKRIIDAIRISYPSHPSYTDIMGQHGDSIREYFNNIVTCGQITPYVHDDLIYEELYALYAYEKYRDELC